MQDASRKVANQAGQYASSLTQPPRMAVPVKMLSVDTSLRNIIRREEAAKQYLEQSYERKRRRRGTSSASLTDETPYGESALPTISE